MFKSQIAFVCIEGNCLFCTEYNQRGCIDTNALQMHVCVKSSHVSEILCQFLIVQLLIDGKLTRTGLKFVLINCAFVAIQTR